MRSFSIKDLEKLSGIRTHTIRVWEQRYAVLQPGRTAGNIRRYSINELHKLLSIALLNEDGCKISHLARLSNKELEEKTGHLPPNKRLQKAINSLVICMYNMEIAEFEAILDECFLAWPVAEVVDNIVFPFLQKVNLLSQGKRLTEEHLVVTPIRKKMYWSIEKATTGKTNGRTILLFLFGERQLDLLLLYAYYQLKKSGWDVIYLGVDVSLKNLEEIISLKKPQYLLTYLSKKETFLREALSQAISRLMPEAHLVMLHPSNALKNELSNLQAIKYEQPIALSA